MRRQPTTCLFCGRMIFPPEEKATEIGQVIYGKCECGAIYVCDPTGHNQGDALIDAMLLASPEGIENFEFGVNFELREKDYDLRTHRYVEMKNQIYTGRIFFIKPFEGGMTEEMQEKIKITKKDFISLVEKRDFETIKKASVQNKLSLGWLISLSYDKENPISWKAIEAMGHIASAYIKAKDTDTLRNTIRKLLWSMTDESGGIGWRAAELIGEIIYAEPSLFEDLIPILWSQREEESFLESVLRGILKLSQKVNLSDYINFDCEEIANLLKHENNTIKSLSALLIKKTNCPIDISEEIKKLPINIYKEGEILNLKTEEVEKFL